ncbi:MAG: DUF2971 domain-containing protein [Bacteroidaceae bacterium]|nr:DUF2971 domain-containing protein [Bacteroidaceae bacterium]
MNDPNDCRYFFKEVSEQLRKETSYLQEDVEKRLAESMSKVGIPYFISLSAQGDFLPMWSLYGKGGHGVSIGFSEVALRKAVENYQKIGDVHQRALAKSSFCKLYKCNYWNQKDIHTKFIEHYNVRMDHSGDLKGLNNNDICSVSYIIKHPDYEFEKESRIIFLVNPNNRIEYAYYLNLYIPIDAITKIICGPCTDKDLVKAIIPDELKPFVVQSNISYTDSPQQITPGFGFISQRLK